MRPPAGSSSLYRLITRSGAPAPATPASRALDSGAPDGGRHDGRGHDGGAHGDGGGDAGHAGGGQCQLCAEPIPAAHRHLLDLGARRLCCACRACAVLFDSPTPADPPASFALASSFHPAASSDHAASSDPAGHIDPCEPSGRDVTADRGPAGGQRYRLIPDRRWYLPGFVLDDATWAGLRLPVEMAFFFHDTRAGRIVAFYPSPAGAVESLLDLDCWHGLMAANPVLDTLLPDVEALLVNRARGARDHWLVPIDDCYALTGLIRTHWSGLSGGARVWTELAAYFADLRARARIPNPAPRSTPIGSTTTSPATTAATAAPIAAAPIAAALTTAAARTTAGMTGAATAVGMKGEAG